VELDRWRLMAGDVLIIEGNGSALQIGRTALFRGELENCVHQNHVIRIRPDRTLLLGEFLNLFLNSPDGQVAVQAQSRSTSGLRTLSVSRIGKIRVPVPSIESQRTVLRSADSAKLLFRSLEGLRAQVGRETNALFPSILDKAFKGEL
jgi:type I restriction enzyme S subunit